jgi:hypothetical protein
MGLEEYFQLDFFLEVQLHFDNEKGTAMACKNFIS